MKTKWLAMAGVILSISPLSLALAGGHSGNGGGAFVCQDPTKSEFLDLFEGRIPGFVTKDGLQYQPSNASMDDQIKSAFGRLSVNPYLQMVMQATYDNVVKTANLKIMPPEVGIAWPADEKNSLQKKGCQPTGIFLFNDEKHSLEEDQESFTSLPATQQAAAWVHETVYRFMRDVFQDTDSIRSRKIVAHLFSTESDADLVEALDQITGLKLDSAPASANSTLSDPSKTTGGIASLVGFNHLFFKTGRVYMHVSLDHPERKCSFEVRTRLSHEINKDWQVYASNDGSSIDIPIDLPYMAPLSSLADMQIVTTTKDRSCQDSVTGIFETAPGALDSIESVSSIETLTFYWY